MNKSLILINCNQNLIITRNISLLDAHINIYKPRNDIFIWPMIRWVSKDTGTNPKGDSTLD